jgi:hypothetical protein
MSRNVVSRTGILPSKSPRGLHAVIGRRPEGTLERVHPSHPPRSPPESAQSQAGTLAARKQKAPPKQTTGQGGASDDPVVSLFLANVPLFADMVRDALSDNPTLTQPMAALAMPAMEVDDRDVDHSNGPHSGISHEWHHPAYSTQPVTSHVLDSSATHCKPRSFRALVKPAIRARIHALGYVEL